MPGLMTGSGAAEVGPFRAWLSLTSDIAGDVSKSLNDALDERVLAEELREVAKIVLKAQ